MLVLQFLEHWFEKGVLFIAVGVQQSDFFGIFLMQLRTGNLNNLGEAHPKGHQIHTLVRAREATGHSFRSSPQFVEFQMPAS